MAADKRLLDMFIPRQTRRSIMRRVQLMTARPPIGRIDFGDLRRTEPLCGDWGYSRGTPIDRYYIDRFLDRHGAAVRGRVLEVGTDEMTRRYGGGRVTAGDVLHVADAGGPVTIVGDLTKAHTLPANAFDCAIVTQTLHFIYDIHAAVASLYATLKPGGVALVTVPGISRISPEDADRWGQYWSFTSMSARLLFEESFPADGVTVEAAGNVLAATAFLQGIAAEELTAAELDHVDVYFETLLGIRARKPV